MMRPQIRFYAKRKKRSPNADLLLSAARWVAALFSILYLAWVTLWPDYSGFIGRSIHGGVFWALGDAGYLLPPLLLYGLALWFKSQKNAGYWIWGAGMVFCLASAATLFSAAGSLTGHALWGGTFGNGIHSWLKDTIGGGGEWLIAVSFELLGLQILFEISWQKVFARITESIADDFKTWAKARGELKEQLRSAAARPAAAAAVAAPPPLAEISPAVAALQAAPGAPAAKKNGRNGAHKPKAEKPAKAEPAYVPSANDKYRLPSLELLQPKDLNAKTGPEEAEIRQAIESLDKTLASFGIQARVTGFSPGPVITRYEVSPSPGVTVGSIVARQNDLALAMKAKGIRMIAPIPGKAAIGIEIPNQHPAGVTLREVLESKAIASHKSLLAFVLGLSSDGTPLAADLQTLPHLLVAGATNSGKSVMMHSLIQSILFRSRPDQVKFLMIDPKRIELSLYEGIPHLYDPKTPAENVGVITHSKDAARSLKALIMVMESRYEKFQVYKARDIESFNRQAVKDGRPPEFYIVVVIDELADLMVVARDVVEDSIQRLAQMARAVGIHLVLATQRPSVDVITGVIKANLPSRIALRVASKVDSKVILDGSGAESLLGRGDMLYLAPGQEPARVQGAYISTDEIGQVVEFLKTQGKPEYPVLGTMAAVGEEDLHKYGVEPMEFTQALQLVMERRRVSQDLLKSQFGSSARATNLLSLLEVKQFIFKPEGTNRWEIHFDKIEDYLKARPANKP